MEFLTAWPELWHRLIFPLLRLICFMSVSLLLANLLEAMHWTRIIARLTAPLARMGHMGQEAGAAFALAFFSPSASNALLAESHSQGRMSRTELVLSNLFNSTPAYMVHLPSLFMLAFSFLGPLAFVYIGLTFIASLLRTFGTALIGAFMLPAPEQSMPAEAENNPRDWHTAFTLTWKRFKKRIWRIISLTVPIYCLFFAMQHLGWFAAAENFMGEHAGFLSFLKPQAIGIVALYLAAESGAAISAAAALAQSGSLAPPEIVMALMVGNIISSPIRAVRHQFPSYAGFFNPSLALLLVLINQVTRAGSLIAVTWAYWLWVS